MPGSYVRLSVVDDGVGMSDATLTHVAEPFFTTKDVGKGTGLGLSMVKSFADQSGGGFAIESTVGVGTTATLWLPSVTGRCTGAAGGSGGRGRAATSRTDPDRLMTTNWCAIR